MSDKSERTVNVLVTDDGIRVQCDAPGERAVSAPVLDPRAFIVEVARKAGYEVDESVPGELYVSWPV